MVRARASSAQAGYTLLELMFVVVIGLLALVALTLFMQTASSVANQAHAELEEGRRERRDLETLASALRDGLSQSVTIMAGDRAKSRKTPYDQRMKSQRAEPVRLSFDRVADVDAGEVRLEGGAVIAWQPHPNTRGPNDPGGVYLVTSNGAELLCSQVVEGGFDAWMEDHLLQMRVLRLRRTGTGDEMERVSLTACVYLRN